MAARTASAQASTSASALSPRSAVSVRAMSAMVSARASSSARRTTQSPGVTGTGLRVSGQSVECFIQVFPGDRLRAPVVDDRACRCAEEEDGVRNPGEHLRAKQRAVDDVLARLSERDEMTGEVSTVDRGYVFGIERAEVTRVIPVIEVTTETLEAVHRSERSFEPLDCSHGAEPAEIVRSDGGEEIQPEVGGRRAVGHDWCWLFLEIVGRKGVVFRADKGLEEPPGSARG